MLKSLKDFHTFANWETLLAYVRSERPLYYHAPMDYLPRLIRARNIKGDTVTVVLVTPLSSDCDPFHADTDHLDRFRFRFEV